MLSSCGLTLSSYESQQSRSYETIQDVISTPLLVDLQIIGDKIQYSETFDFKISEIPAASVEPMISEFKKMVVAKASKKYNADAIIGVLHDVSTTRNQIILSITGYPARYVNFRTATPDDMWIIDAHTTLTKKGSDPEIIFKEIPKKR